MYCLINYTFSFIADKLNVMSLTIIHLKSNILAQISSLRMWVRDSSLCEEFVTLRAYMKES